MQWYEENGIRFSDCRPYLWGDAAVTHHSIRTEISVSLKRQPQPNQVLELLDMNIIKNTLKYFPLDRSLQVILLYNMSLFKYFVKYLFVNYENILVLQPGKRLHHIETKIYDLSFILPLMSHLLASESRISVQKFTRSGGLSLILAALASDVSEVRMGAFHCLQRFHCHLSRFVYMPSNYSTILIF